ncbi:MAG: sulfocyanin-like copper-binding protein [Caldilineaceae bacterium]
MLERLHIARKKTWFIFVAVIFAGIAASCSFGQSNNSGAAGQPTATTRPTPLPVPTFHVAILDIMMRDYYYGDSDTNISNPPIWTVPKDADVILTLENQGTYKHNWAIVKKGSKIPNPYKEGQGGDIILYGVGMVYSNSKTTVTFSAPAPGEYTIICTVSGHYPTMQGRLVVK